MSIDYLVENLKIMIDTDDNEHENNAMIFPSEDEMFKYMWSHLIEAQLCLVHHLN